MCQGAAGGISIAQLIFREIPYETHRPLVKSALHFYLIERVRDTRVRPAARLDSTPLEKKPTGKKPKRDNPTGENPQDRIPQETIPQDDKLKNSRNM